MIMKGLIIKDFIGLGKSFKLVGFMLLFYSAISIITKSPYGFSGMFTLIFALFLLNTYSLDELANWDTYAITMPLSRDNIIQGKYLLMLLLSFLGFIINAGSLLILNIATKAESLFAGIEVPMGGMIIVIIFYSILLPIITKVGITKARIYIIVIYMVPFLLGTLIYKKVKEINPSPSEGLMEVIIENIFKIAPIVLFACFGISYFTSIRIYRKKEF